jgi:hypothetical protein
MSKQKLIDIILSNKKYILYLRSVFIIFIIIIKLHLFKKEKS